MGFLGIGLGLFVLAALGVAAAAAGRASGGSPPQQLAPGAAGPPLLPPPQPQPQPAQPPVQIPVPLPGGLTAAEALLFDLTAQGVRVFKLAMVQQVLAMLDAYAVVPVVAGDPSVVKIVPRTSPAHATARQWCEQWNAQYTILGCKWLTLPVQVDRFLRAVPQGTEAQWAAHEGVYAVLGWPKTLGVPHATPLPEFPSVPGFPPVVLPQAPPVVVVPQVPPAVVPVMPPPFPQPPQPFPQPPPVNDAFSTLPPQLQAEARKTYQEAKNPEALELVASQLDKAGYSEAAEAMRRRAADLRAAQGIKQAASGKVHQIREGDIPSYLAMWYTGNAGRWTELPSVNPGMSVQKVNGVTQLVPWKVGSYVNLPPDWNVARGVPPTQRALKAAQAALEQKPQPQPDAAAKKAKARAA